MRWWPLLLGLSCAARHEPELMRRAAEGLAASRPPPKGAVVLRCEPLDAEVWVDQVPVGTCVQAADRLPLAGNGWRHLQVKKPGFQTWETWVEAGGARAVLNAKLVPES